MIDTSKDVADMNKQNSLEVEMLNNQGNIHPIFPLRYDVAQGWV